MSRPHHRTLWRTPRGEDRPAAQVLDLLGATGLRQEHDYRPQGSSALAVAPHLTLAVHTWPEHGLATLDTYGTPLPDLSDRLASIGWMPLPEVRRC